MGLLVCTAHETQQPCCSFSAFSKPGEKRAEMGSSLRGPSHTAAVHQGPRLGSRMSSGCCLDKREPNKAGQLGTSLKAFLVVVLLIFLNTGENSQTVLQHVCGIFFFPGAPAQSLFLHPGFCLLTFHLPLGSERAHRCRGSCALALPLVPAHLSIQSCPVISSKKWQRCPVVAPCQFSPLSRSQM